MQSISYIPAKKNCLKPDGDTFFFKFKVSTEVELNILMKQKQFDFANKYRSSITFL